MRKKTKKKPTNHLAIHHKAIHHIKKILKRKVKIIRAPPDKIFYLSDGRQLRDIKELAKALKNMSEYVFKYHVNEQKDDFASWIKAVLRDRKLASSLKKIKDQQAYQSAIAKRIKDISAA